jgi:hypothetical protein
MYKHQNDKSGTAAIQGDKAETLFVTKLIGKGIKYRTASLQEDKYSHNDCYIINEENQIGIDVKSHKKRYRYDSKPDETYVAIEISNNYGYSWALDPTSGYIAFQYHNTFYLVSRKDLQKYIKNSVDLKQTKIENKQRPKMDVSDLEHNLFYRSSQPRECITYVSWETIKLLATKTI